MHFTRFAISKSEWCTHVDDGVNNFGTPGNMQSSATTNWNEIKMNGNLYLNFLFFKLIGMCDEIIILFFNWLMMKNMLEIDFVFVFHGMLKAKWGLQGWLYCNWLLDYSIKAGIPAVMSVIELGNDISRHSRVFAIDHHHHPLLPERMTKAKGRQQNEINQNPNISIKSGDDPMIHFK